ncbi:hypothetical protein KCP70_24680 [Salmonella enterica subsp. enterica]|nr:hypothetical protein KCP70_24680 [Salmonella enterica subsp. enterica]
MCGSDIHYYQHGRAQRMSVLKHPMVIVHEVCWRDQQSASRQRHGSGPDGCGEPVSPCNQCGCAFPAIKICAAPCALWAARSSIRM